MFYVASVRNRRSGEWEYAGYDKYGSYSSGMPTLFTNLEYADKYETVNEAEERLVSWKNNLYGDLSDYDWSSFAIRKVNIVFTVEKKLTMSKKNIW